MPDPIRIEPLLELVAFQRFWSVFLPEDGSGEDDTPSIEVRAEWLTGFLMFWSWHVDHFLADVAAVETSGPDGNGLPRDRQAQRLELLLESLANAAEALLAFKRRDHLIEVPDSFSETANLLLGHADQRGVRTKDSTVSRIARRLSAAKSHMATNPRPVKVDERGQVFDLSGQRLFQFEPAKVLEGMQDVRAGRTHSLRELREAEGPNGR